VTNFGAIDIASSGLALNRKWMDAISDNIANVNTPTTTDVDAFRERFVVAQAEDYGTGEGGVSVAGIALGTAEGRMVYEPDNPLADEGGYVQYPDIDLGAQMGQMIMAQRSYQANLSVVTNAREAYQSALDIGRNV